MQLLSMQENAAKLNNSERRVQKLIPDTAEKPIDRRLVYKETGFVSMLELCSELSISVATGRNWLKLGKITPQVLRKSTPFFSQEYVQALKQDIQQGRKNALKSRRNKKYVSGNNLYSSYVSDESKNIGVVENVIAYLENEHVEITEDLMLGLLADCAIQLIAQHEKGMELPDNLYQFLEAGGSQRDYGFLVSDLLEDVDLCSLTVDRFPILPMFKYVYEKSEDILGLLYISLRNIGNRKATGSYYTPTAVVRKLCGHLLENEEQFRGRILDPCCGTGNFILQLPDCIGLDCVFGNDIDMTSVKLARINYALKYGIKDKTVIYEHVTQGDYLSWNCESGYDIIFGNPPWGFEFTKMDRERMAGKFASAKGSNVESYDVFVEQALRNLNVNGVLSFVLPEAILNVKAHTAVRKMILQNNSIQYLEYLGNAFYGVQCPCIILQILHNGKRFDSKGMIVNEGWREYGIGQSRRVSADYFSFSMTDEEYAILNKIANLSTATTLKDQAVFALGIVTGNNKEYISDKKNSENEMVLKGADIYKYRYRESDSYISFKPGSFQQIAPTEYYRAKEKLLYRFICNQLVFAYDDRQTLSLNSCNIVIPNIESLSMRYIMTVLNSRIAQYFFKKTFNSVKVLKAHIEAIPIPVISCEEQVNYELMSQKIELETDRSIIKRLYEEIDCQIAALYGLTEKEYSIICQSVREENLFLY